MLTNFHTSEIFKKILSSSKADQTEVILTNSDFSLTRFADSVIHQNISREDYKLTVKSIIGKRIGLAETNQIDDDSIQNTVLKAYNIAQQQPETPDFISLPENQLGYDINRFSKKTFKFSPEDRADGVLEIVKLCDKNKLKASGAFQTNTEVVSVANSLGINRYHIFTSSSLSLTVTGDNGNSGWANEVAKDVSDIDPEQVANVAISKALSIPSYPPSVLKKDVKAGERVELPPGEYTVILEPDAVVDLILLLSFLGFGCKSFAEGRSFMSGKIGEKITGDNITIIDDVTDEQMIGIPFDYEGVPRQKVILIEKGIAKGVVYNSYYANKSGVKSTGHALPPDNSYGAYPKNLILYPGDSSINEMIMKTDRGILITHFWYTNYMNPMKTQITGTTRDGTFLIEDGKIKSAIKDMRFGQSILEALSNVELISRDLKLCQKYGIYLLLPALKINKFNFIENK